MINADKITNRVREVKISKTNLVKLSNCERRTAWNVQYGLPREDYVEYESESTATKFHQFSQKLLVNNENFSDNENIESFNQLTNEEDEVTREQLFLKYQQLVSQLNNYDDLKIKEEFNFKQTAKDVLITSQLRTALITNKKIKSANYDIDTYKKIIYIYGISQNEEERAEVINEAKQVLDVEDVVTSIF